MKTLYDCSIMLLARREHSQAELRQKLSLKFPLRSDDIEAILQRLIETNEQSDLRYAEVYLKSRLSKGYGLRRVQQELRLKGVSDAVMTTALSQADTAPALQKIKHLWLKKFKGLPQNTLQKSQQMRFFLTRGYSQDDIKNLWENSGMGD